jgi:UDP-N-acetylmuramoyl-tripeptide--D-alanyl-D-alanine ligase
MLTLDSLHTAVGGRIIQKGPEEFSGVSIDSRTIKDGELFIALRGEHHDGHAFLDAALQKAHGAIVCRDFDCSRLNHTNQHRTIIAVENTLKALQAAASYCRNMFSGHVIGVVGSNGKTTTKELIASVLSTRFIVHKTTGNLNNHIGLPLTLIRAPQHAEILVVEMGTNQPGDIKNLCEIARPTIGVVTNIGMEHLQGFGDLFGVRDAELELLPYVNIIIANADDAFLMHGVKERFQGKIFSFGMQSPAAAVSASACSTGRQGTSFWLETEQGRTLINLKLFGMFNILNALAAAAAGQAAGLLLDEIRTGLESFAGVAMRFSVKKHNDITWLADIYNANPSSMDLAINELMQYKDSGKRMVAVLGDMLELGAQTYELHASLGKRLLQQQIDFFIGVGSHMRAAVNAYGDKACSAADAEEAAEILRRVLRAGDVVLVKGSRGMFMEKIFEALGIPLT